MTKPVEMILSDALAVALTAPDAEARWLAGEPVFAGLPLDQAEQNRQKQDAGDRQYIGQLLEHMKTTSNLV